MKKKNNILLISGNLLKHKYVAIKILQKFKNCNVIFENYPKEIYKKYTSERSKTLIKHFNYVKKYDQKYFYSFCKYYERFLKKKTLFKISKGNINKTSIINRIKNYKPKLIVINATSILKNNFLKNFERKIINIHAGLLPYYRGTGCNVWTFFNNELQYTGITIHFVNNKIDDGHIINQLQSKFSKTDNTHSIGCKNAIMASRLAKETISFLIKNPNYKGKIIRTKKKRLYKNKDFTDNIVLRVNSLIKEGIVEQYCKKSKQINIIKLK